MEMYIRKRDVQKEIDTDRTIDWLKDWERFINFNKSAQFICDIIYRLAVYDLTTPKMKMVSSFNHPHVIPNLWRVFSGTHMKNFYKRMWTELKKWKKKSFASQE